MRKNPRQTLSELERAVMQVLWNSRAVTVEGVQESLRPERELSSSTVRTVLSRLEKKEYASHRVDGRVNVYEPAVEPEAVGAGTLRQILDRFFGGSAEALVAGMVKHDIIDPEELEQIARRLAEAEDR